MPPQEMTLLNDYQEIMGPPPTIGGCSQDELDELGHLLDRLEELEIFFEAPSITRDQKQDTWIEMESVMEKIDYYMYKV